MEFAIIGAVALLYYAAYKGLEALAEASPFEDEL